MNLKSRSLLTGLLFFTTFSFAQFGPNNGVKTSKSERFLIENATVYINPTTKMSQAYLLIENGRIVEISERPLKTDNATVVDLKGKTIVPSFIELYSNVGLPKYELNNRSGYGPQLETSKSGAYYWNEAIHPENHAAPLFANDEKTQEKLLKAGFGFALTHQHDGIVRGTGTLISLDGNSTHQQLISNQAAQFYSFSKGVSRQTYPSSQMGAIALLRQALYDLNYYSSQTIQQEKSVSLDAWKSQLQLPAFFKTEDKWEILRALKISDEFKIPFIYVGSGNEYAAIQQLAKRKNPLVIPLNFPDAYDVKDPYVARQIPLSDLKHWELAPSNPFILFQHQVPFSLTTHGLSSPDDFWKNLRKALTHGLPIDAALNALTLYPAQLLHLENEIGSLEKGRWASFSVYEKDPFLYEANALETWSQGKRKIWKELPQNDLSGTYNLTIDGKKYPLELQLTQEKYSAKITTIESKEDLQTKQVKKDSILQKGTVWTQDNDFVLQFNCNDANFKGSLQLHGKIKGNGGVFEGDALLPDGRMVPWVGVRSAAPKTWTKEYETVKIDSTFKGNVWFPNLAYGLDSTLAPTNYVLSNVTIWTNEKEGIIKNGMIIIENGKIKYVGASTRNYPTKAVVIDGKGMHLTSGIIDEHSHIAISKGVNEGGQAISAEVSIADVVNPDDINIYRQLAGGVTAAQLLHGSANPIGGQSALIKLKWGGAPDDFLIPNANGFIKCALGENVKQANWGDYNTVRFPQTRMGVEQVFVDAFTRARAYNKEWEDYRKLGKTKSPAPRFDLELEVLNEILDKKRFITCHSYVQSEINMLMHVADSFGFNINTFTHILEGYKLADKMKAHGASGSTFSDWWAYKFEVNDAIPYNAKMMADQGVTVAINSDDAEMGRRLNQEAAKCVKYGGMSEEEAWKLVTLNPAKMLHLDDRMGSVKVGKDADLVLWSDHPLSITAKAELTFVDGNLLYNRSEQDKLIKRNEIERARIITKMQSSNDKGEPVKPFVKKGRKHFHCDTLGEEGTEAENHH
ncbi:MAG: hypothetical protein RL264_2429 [Bacteroidota bacterium]|jgi:imidazolonepropionase-like amidohydrolase